MTAITNQTPDAQQRITVQVRSVYGLETIYPACKTSLLFANLAGTKTLTEDAMRLIVAAGYRVDVEAPRLRFAA